MGEQKHYGQLFKREREIVKKYEEEQKINRCLKINNWPEVKTSI